MAAPLRLCVSLRFLDINSGVFRVAAREYRSKQKIGPKRIDPRQNSQYPYTPGDPQHEDQIQKLNKFDEKNTKKHKSKKESVNNDLFGNPNLKQNSVDRSKRVSQHGLVYEKLKDGDLRLGRTILKAKSSNESETILLEGYRLIRDAIQLGAELKYLYFSTEDILNKFPQSILQGAQIYKILYRDMKTWSDTTTPSGILGVFKRPEQGESYIQGSCLPLTLILDQIKDPGNVGTLIRSAAAVGCERILVLKGCANVWEGKVLRSAMGGHFVVPIYSGLTWSQVYSYIENSTRVFLADARAESDIVRAFDRTLSVENDDAVSSTDSSDSDDNDDSSSDSDTDNYYDTQTSEQNEVYNHMAFPVIPYSNVILHPSQFGKEESVALVIGNETEGLSPAAKKFAYKNYGTFVTVPMHQAVDSLNTAVAGSIILYEIRRKMLDLIGSSSER